MTGRLGYLGVFLDHDPSDFGVSPRHSGSGSIDLGWSTAIDQDTEDDGYDLSWSHGLSDDDQTAIGQLERLLDEERDPVDRHFILNFLAERLYRRRDEDPDALSRFDVVCEGTTRRWMRSGRNCFVSSMDCHACRCTDRR